MLYSLFSSSGPVLPPCCTGGVGSPLPFVESGVTLRVGSPVGVSPVGVSLVGVGRWWGGGAGADGEGTTREEVTNADCVFNHRSFLLTEQAPLCRVGSNLSTVGSRTVA